MAELDAAFHDRQLHFFQVALVVLIVLRMRLRLRSLRAERERLQRRNDTLRRFHVNASRVFQRREAVASTQKLLNSVAMDLQVSDKVRA
jgi:hypothetical protein